MKNINNKILLLIKIPPPITGATLMNKRVNDSVLLHQTFDIRSICISYVNSVDELGGYKFKKIITFISVMIKLFNELIFKKPAFIYFQISPLGFAFLRDLCFAMIIKLFKVKIVYHLRGKGIKEQAKKKWKRNLYKFAFRNSQIICLSNLLTYDIEHVFDGTIHIVNNGIPDIENKYLKLSTENMNDIPKLLYLSNLHMSKGILDFIEALKILNEKEYQFSANIVGAEGNFLINDLRKIIIYNKLVDKVNYLGPQFGQEKYKILTQSDIFVFPTKNDIWGNVILEAMQFGLPVVATGDGAIPEIVENEITGFLVEKSNSKQLANKVERLINNPDLRIKMGKAGRKKYIEKYTITKFEQNMKVVFQEVLDRIN